MNISIFNEPDNTLKNLTANTEVETLQFELTLHKRLLDVFQVGDYYYYVTNIPATAVVYCSKEVTTVLGYDPADVTLALSTSNIHPEDSVYIVNFEHRAAEFLKQLPMDKLMKYKVRYDKRIQKKDGSYIRVLHQFVVIQHDTNGNILLKLAVDTDITHLKKEGKPELSFIDLDSEPPSLIDVKAIKPLIPLPQTLSKREKEILQLMLEGRLSKEISALLHISNQTVETHRKNMVKKAKVKNSAELIAQAIKKGWI